jgi:hypothetical protein
LEFLYQGLRHAAGISVTIIYKTGEEMTQSSCCKATTLNACSMYLPSLQFEVKLKLGQPSIR